MASGTRDGASKAAGLAAASAFMHFAQLLAGVSALMMFVTLVITLLIKARASTFERFLDGTG